MAQIINTNIASLNAQRNLNTSQSANGTALERLSSGLRINSAKDDAAGLAISTKFESQTRGLNQAIRNAGDGISLAQTAEGALGSMTDNLQRVRELAVQSSNETNSDEDRVALQQEVRALVAEITRTADETNFNGRNLFDGNFDGTFQIGANAGQTVDVQIGELTAGRLGSSAQAGVSSYSTDTAIGNGDLVINGEAIRASVAGDDLLSTSDKNISGISKAAAINDSSEITGVVATVDSNVVIGSDMASSPVDGSAGATLTLNGVDIALQGTDNSDDAARAGTRGSVIEAINSKADQTGVIASDGGNEGGVILTAEDGRNITYNLDDDGTAFGLADTDTATDDNVETFYSGFTLTAQNAQTDIVVSGGNGTGNGDISNSGLSAGTYTSQTAVTTTQAQTVDAGNTATGLTDGDLVINGVAIRAASTLDDSASATTSDSSSAAASGIALAAAINDASDDTGVTATVNATEQVGTAAAADGTAGDGVDFTINDVTINLTETGDAEKNKAAAITAINEVSGETGVIASDNGSSLTLTAVDGRNISTYSDTGANTSSGNSGGEIASFGLTGVTEAAGATDATTGGTVYSTVSLNSASAFEVSYGSNGDAALASNGFEAGTFGGGQDGTFLKDVDISTFQGAQDAITAIDNALETVASQRAELGALQNRFESTVSNLAITAENLTAANSRIRDADFAAETAELSRTQVLQQAGISILAQANQRPQQVLSLLG